MSNDKQANTSPFPTLMTCAVVIVVLLAVIVIQNMLRSGPTTGGESAATQSAEIEIQKLRSEINRERITLGLSQLNEGDGSRSATEIAQRIQADSQALASLATNYQLQLSRKDTELQEARALSRVALDEQERLRKAVDKAEAEAAKVDRIKRQLDEAYSTISQLNEQLKTQSAEPENLRTQLTAQKHRLAELEGTIARLTAQTDRLAELQETIARLEAQLRSSNDMRAGLEKQIAQMQTNMQQAVLFARSEGELVKDAIALVRALRKLEGATAKELSAAYSRFGVELRSEVLDTCEFDTGSAVVRPELESRLPGMLSNVPQNALLLVAGYASETGAVDNNRTLSSDRATAVARIIQDTKRPDLRVQAVYLGQTDRFSATSPLENQRVEIWQINAPELDSPPAVPMGSPTEPPIDTAAPPLRPLREFR